MNPVHKASTTIRIVVILVLIILSIIVLAIESRANEVNVSTDKIITYLNPRVDPNIAVIIGNTVDKYSFKYKLPRNLILSIILKESSFDYLAKSKVAFGLMQIYPKFHQEKLDKRNINDLREIYHIDKNIDIGCEIFKEYYTKANGNMEETFHMYISKNATEKQRDYYMKIVYDTWIKIDFYEYQQKEYNNGKK